MEHHSYITALDWSLCGTLLKSTCGAYETIYYQPEQSADARMMGKHIV